MASHFKALAKRTTPKTIAIFPLAGSVLLPGCDLPLNIFEPRYLNMIDDALKNERLIGMVQPALKTGGESSETDQYGGLCRVGGLGRIMQFAETDDGRYMVVLRGLRRFSTTSTADTKTPYAQANVEYTGFENDINVHEDSQTPEAMSGQAGERSVLTMAMKAYAKTLGVKLDWGALKKIPLPRLVDQTAMISPFPPQDKQALIETQTHEERRRLLIGLMHLYSDVENDNQAPTLQ